MRSYLVRVFLLDNIGIETYMGLVFHNKLFYNNYVILVRPEECDMAWNRRSRDIAAEKVVFPRCRLHIK